MGASPVELMQDALLTALVVAMPVLVVALAVGIVVSLFQAASQVQDQAVSAVPKLVACGIAVVLLAGWMVARLVEFAQAMFTGAA